MFSKIDFFLRKKWSYFFRLILLLYSFYLISICSDNYFNIQFYISASIIYLLLFFLLKKNGYSALRTLNDFIFIFFILFEKNLESSVNYFCLLIPLINSQNNSGKKNNYWGYFLALLILLLIINFDKFSNYNNSFKFYLIVPLLVIFSIDYFLRFRDKIKKLNEKLFEIIDGLYGLGFDKINTIKVYKDLITQLNQFGVLKKLNILYIVCFIFKRNQKLLLVNGSEMIIDYGFENEQELINELNKENEAQNYKFRIYKKTFDNTQYFKLKTKKRSYSFLVIYKRNYPSKSPFAVIRNFIINDFILTPAFKHLTRLFDIQIQIDENRYKSLVNVSNKLDYVLKANEVMHFVKGSLSPIKDALSLSEQIDITTKYEDKKFVIENFRLQRKAAKLEIQNIIDRSNFILAKSKNPFEADVFQCIKSFELYTHIRAKWENRFFDKEVIVTGDNVVSILNTEININYEILDLILINIFSNITKYSVGGEELEFNINFNGIKIIFYNLREFKGKNQRAELEKIIEYYNKKNRLEISKRKTHGFVHLRTYSEAIGFESSMFLEKNKFGFNLEINYEKDENSNI